MLTIADYDLLVLRGFEALKREISEAEQFTYQHYNQLVSQQKPQGQEGAKPKTPAAKKDSKGE